MFALLVLILGLLIGVFGFVVMRNPMRLSLLSPWSEGYLQRLVLDTLQRIQLRVVGALVCLFGSSLFANACASLLQSRYFAAVGEGFWVLMGLTFACAFISVVVIAIRQITRGEVSDWWRMFRTGAELGPISTLPSVTPRMQREARWFTISLCSLAVIAGLAALVR